MGGSMYEKIIKDQFGRFESNIVEFIKTTVDEHNIVDAHLFIFDPDYTRLAYRYDYKNKCDFSFQEINEIVSQSTSISTNRNSEFLLCQSHSHQNCTCEILIINIYQDANDKSSLIGTCFVCLNQAINYNDTRLYINIHHFEQICLHVQSIIMNYEKLFYIIDVFTELLMAKDKFMPYHMSNVAHWAINLSVNLNITERDQTILYISALLHDIGKLFIRDSIINKPDRLDDLEFEEIKKHPAKGAEIVKSLFYGMQGLDEVEYIIKCHHENYDGSGYPNQLKGEDIPYLSRVLKVSDAVDAMLSRRAYKEAEDIPKIVTELTKYSGIQFDPHIASTMIELLNTFSTNNKNDSIANTNFIAHASLSFYYEDDKTIESFNGNLIVHDKKGHFIVHDSTIESDYMIQQVHKATISFFSLNDFIEYKVNVDGSLSNKFFINDFTYIPTDKLFSMIWSGHVDIFYGQNLKTARCNIVKLGGNSLVIEIDEALAHEIISDRLCIRQVLLDENLEEIHVKFLVQVNCIKYYQIHEKYIFILKYLDIMPSDRDKLLKMLFKKQYMDKLENKQAFSDAFKKGVFDGTD